MKNLLLAIALSLSLAQGAAAQDYAGDESPIHCYGVYHPIELQPVGIPGFARPDGSSPVVARFADGYILQVSGYQRDARGHAWFTVTPRPGKTCYVRADRSQLATVIDEGLTPNAKGDFPENITHQFWQVVDNDPAGTKACTVPDGVLETRFPKGTILRAMLNPFCQFAQVDGKRWLMVSSPTGTYTHVRANARCIRPCPGPDPFKPLQKFGR